MGPCLETLGPMRFPTIHESRSEVMETNKDLNNETIQGSFYEFELLKTKFGSAWPGENKDNEIVSIPGLRGRDPKEITLKKVKNEIKIVDYVFYFPSCKELLFLLGRNCIQSCVKIIVSYLTRRKGDIMAS